MGVTGPVPERNTGQGAPDPGSEYRRDELDNRPLPKPVRYLQWPHPEDQRPEPQPSQHLADGLGSGHWDFLRDLHLYQRVKFGVRRQLYPGSDGNPRCPALSRCGQVQTNPPPLWIWRRMRHLRPGESAVAAARGEPESQVLGKRRGYPHCRGPIRPRRSAGALQISPESIKSLRVYPCLPP